jgi:hypothetical protein
MAAGRASPHDRARFAVTDRIALIAHRRRCKRYALSLPVTECAPRGALRRFAGAGTRAPRRGRHPAGHAIAMHGAPAMPTDFTALPYANPDAPKGGRLVQGVLGTFDSLNPLIVKGLAVQPIRGYVVESLMARGYDEPFTLYGLLARTIETDDARSYVTFTLDPAAHFSDGTPVTAADVCFPGSSCAITAGPITAPIIPRSPRPRCSMRAPCVSIFAAATTANCR